MAIIISSGKALEWVLKGKIFLFMPCKGDKEEGL